MGALLARPAHLRTSGPLDYKQGMSGTERSSLQTHDAESPASVLVQRVSDEGRARGEAAGTTSTQSAAGPPPGSTARRSPGGLRSLLQRLGTSFTRPGDDLMGTNPMSRLQLSITAAPAHEDHLPAGLQHGGAGSGMLAVGSPPNLQHQQQHPDGAADLIEQGQAGDVDVAASAERHRLLASSFVDIRQAAYAIERALPFLLLLLVCFVCQHLLSLAALAWLTFVLARLNTVLKAQVALKADLRPQQLLAAAGAIAAQAPLVVLAMRHQHVLDLLLLRGLPPATTDFWSTVFVLASADLVARFAAVLVKVRASPVFAAVGCHSTVRLPHSELPKPSFENFADRHSSGSACEHARALPPSRDLAHRGGVYCSVLSCLSSSWRLVPLLQGCRQHPAGALAGWRVCGT